MVKLLLQRSKIFQNFLTSNLIEISLLKPLLTIKAQKYFKCFFTSNSVYDLFEISVFISCNLYWLFEHILSLVNVLTLCIIAILENSKIKNNLHLTLTFSLDQQEAFKGHFQRLLTLSRPIRPGRQAKSDLISPIIVIVLQVPAFSWSKRLYNYKEMELLTCIGGIEWSSRPPLPRFRSSGRCSCRAWRRWSCRRGGWPRSGPGRSPDRPVWAEARRRYPISLQKPSFRLTSVWFYVDFLQWWWSPDLEEHFSCSSFTAPKKWPKSLGFFSIQHKK